MTQPTPPTRQIRALFDEETVTVYQAYSVAIAGPAVEAQRFVDPFSRDRMTWIKPSFLWMMYRCGWATKPDQERVLAIRMSRTGFETALAGACLSHFDPKVYPSATAWQERKATTSVRVQWDPERDVSLKTLPWRSLQVGLGGSAVASYLEQWIVAIEDVTSSIEKLRGLPPLERTELPVERPYPLVPATALAIGASHETRPT